MTITSSWDVKKACAKLPLFGLSFGFVHPDGSSRYVARGGSSITMGLSTSPQCWLNTSALAFSIKVANVRTRAREILQLCRDGSLSWEETKPLLEAKCSEILRLTDPIIFQDQS
jgi:hypothetical protein